MSARNFMLVVVTMVAVGAVALPAGAAVMSFSPSGSPPTVDNADIAQLVQGTEVTAPDPLDAIYLFSDRPAQGQSFTTGANPLGYTLTAVTFQHNGSLGTVNGGNPLPIRITQLSGTAITVIHSETAPDLPFPNEGDNEFVTFTLAAPQLLAPNTTYGFDVGKTLGGFAIVGNNSDPYLGGAAYSSGDNGLGSALADFRDGDRVFHIDLQAVLPPVPEPSSLLLLGTGMLALLNAKRRRRA